MSTFIEDRVVMEGLTFDDVLLIPGYSEVLPKTVELSTQFTRHITLNIPFVTAAMDTVTEAPMAIPRIIGTVCSMVSSPVLLIACRIPTEALALCRIAVNTIPIRIPRSGLLKLVRKERKPGPARPAGSRSRHAESGNGGGPPV